MENDGKCATWKMIEKPHPENERIKTAHPENDRKITPWKMTEMSDLEHARMEIAHPGKYQNGKCTTWKMP